MIQHKLNKMELTKKQFKEAKKIKEYLIKHIQSFRKDKQLSRKEYFTITYQELVDRCGLPYPNLNRNPSYRKQLGILLAFLLIDDHQNGRPFITSIIYGKGLYRPRNGFYSTLYNECPEKINYKKPVEIYTNKAYRRTFETEVTEYWMNKICI